MPGTISVFAAGIWAASASPGAEAAAAREGLDRAGGGWEIAAVTVCVECGFRYDQVAAEEAGAAIVAEAGEVAGLLGGDGVRERPRDGVWSALEYACHLRDVLLVQRERVLLALREEQPLAVPMGRDERAGQEGYNEQDPADVDRQLRDAAALLANVLGRLPVEAWERTLLYTYPEPAARSLRWVAAHALHEVRHHRRDVELRR